jgi:curved DNA-binding protein CbpA
MMIPRMNGQLSENPVAELIRELSIKNLSGRLKLQLDKVKVAIYFESGSLIYAASNVSTLRLGEYLVASKLVTDEDLLYLGRKTKDIDLARSLISEKRISPSQAEQLQIKQVSDVLRLVLTWTQGSWEFDHRSHLQEEVNFKVEIPTLLLEGSRRLPLDFTSSRFREPSELLSPVPEPPNISNLSPTEVFILSRLDAPTSLNDLIAVSGMPGIEALRVIYSLSLVGLIERERWRSAFRDLPKQGLKKIKPEPPPPVEEPLAAPTPVETVDSFLNRLAAANSHYEILDVESKATMSELKNAYYDLARKYHPDRFRSSETDLLSRIESAFARITQAYDILRDPGMRATYDSKLEAQARAAKLAQSAPKASSMVDTSAAGDSDNSQLTPAQRAEIHFKEGFAALEMGQRNVALGLLASAARAVPDEPRFRAYYGRALGLAEITRRLAETELQAAVKLDPNNSEYRIMLAELYRDLGLLVRAKGEAERALAADNNNRKARELLRSLG